MIRTILLLTLFTSQTFASFKYKDCDDDCRGKWGICMITRISEEVFTKTCYGTQSSCVEKLDPQSVCIDFVDSVTGNQTIWPDFENHKRVTTAAPISTSEAASSTTDSILEVSSDPAEGPTARGPLSPSMTSTEIVPTTSLPSEPSLQTESGTRNEIMIGGVGLSALVILALILHLCCRRTKKRRNFNEVPLKLHSEDFVEDGFEKPSHTSPKKRVEASTLDSSYL